MKAITLHQPWATLVAIGAKRIETRSWPTSYRGQIAIHAAASFPDYGRKFSLQPVVYDTVGKLCRTHSTRGYPLGSVLATCELVACWPIEVFDITGEYSDGKVFVEMRELEREFGNYGPGRYAWILKNVREFPAPIPAKGNRRIWNWEAEKRAIEREDANAK